MFKDKVLVITGGTGSFGKTVLQKFLNTDIAEIRIFSRDEKKQEDMRVRFNNHKLKFILGDVRDYRSVDSAFRGANYVFHAAALKQVPSCEFHPMEAVNTNILGTQNVLDCALDAGIEKVNLLSTDKAVYPINAMGMSKALAEKVLLSKSTSSANDDTVFCATRYGNVMASRGSVIPLFVKQIKNGEDITITDPNMTRFLMSLDESVQLVLHSFANGKQGDIFVQKAPACTVSVLVEALVEIFGPSRRVCTIGTRHGEKLFETLVSREEMSRSLETDTHYQIKADLRDLNYNKFYNIGSSQVNNIEDYTSHNTTRLSCSEVIEKLLKLDYIKGALNA